MNLPDIPTNQLKFSYQDFLKIAASVNRELDPCAGKAPIGLLRESIAADRRPSRDPRMFWSLIVKELDETVTPCNRARNARKARQSVNAPRESEKNVKHKPAEAEIGLPNRLDRKRPHGPGSFCTRRIGQRLCRWQGADEKRR
jgi:hypothetical protein